MDRRLLRPRWLLAHTAILTVAVTFILLGLWQLSRHQERSELNEQGRQRFGAPAIDFDALIESSQNLQDLEFRHVEVTGEFTPDLEVLIRSQVHLGTAGFHVITPLARDDGEAVLVNRGWVPLTMDRPPVAAAPPMGVVTIEGWVELTEERPPLGPEDPAEGELEVLSRVDVDRIAQQLPLDVSPVYVVQAGDDDELPIPVPPPVFDDVGPHLAYAVQWFGFTLVALIGYFFFARKRLRSR